MKKKKALNKLIITISLLTPTLVYADQYLVCGNDKRIPAIFGTILSTLLTLIKILVPIIFIITGIIAFIKASMAKDADDALNKAQGKLIRNIIVAIIIFFMVSIINFVIALVAGANNNFSDCLNCLINPDDCQKVDELGNKLCPGMIGNQENYNEKCEPINPSEKVDYGSGETGVPDQPTPGGGGTLVENPNALTNQNIVHKSYINGYSYYLYIPKQIDSTQAALIVYLHGTGGTGGDYNNLKGDGGGGFLHEIEDKNVEYNCYILIPHAPKIASSSGWSASDVMGIIEQEVQSNNIDPKRISIWGYSLGAEAVPGIVNANPKYFSSAVLLALGGSWQTNTTGFESLATYGFYGDNDTVGTRTNTPRFINLLKSKNYKAYIREYPPPQGHAYLPNTVLEDTNIGNGYSTIIDWVLEQRRTD